MAFTFLCTFLFAESNAMDRKAPLHIKVKRPEHKPQNTSCPFVISTKTSSKYGLRINLVQRERNDIILASSLQKSLIDSGRDDRVISALYHASLKTGVDFELLVVKAMMESNLGLFVSSRQSSAKGVFHYIEATWLSLIHRYGKKIDFPEYAKAISISESNIPYLKPENEHFRKEILALRLDPFVSALIKGYQIKEEGKIIRKWKDGAHVTVTDHFIVHMLGLNLAGTFYKLKKSNSDVKLANSKNAAMREAVNNNRFFFYGSNKKALNAQQSYAKFRERIAAAQKKISDIWYEYARDEGCERFTPIAPYSPKQENVKEAKSDIFKFAALYPHSETGENKSPALNDKENFCKPDAEFALLSMQPAVNLDMKR